MKNDVEIFAIPEEPDIIGEDFFPYTQEDLQRAVREAGYLDAPPEFSQQSAIAQLEADLMQEAFIRDQLKEKELLEQQNMEALDAPSYTQEDLQRALIEAGYLDNTTINYKTLLDKEAEKRNWKPNQIKVFENWRNSVGQIESNNIPTRTQGDSPTGIGRGKYQYETSKGSATNKTAINRLKSFLKKYNFSINDLPESDRKVLSTSDPDFSLLSEDTQDIIFLADKSKAPEAKLNDLVSGIISPVDAWINWHWKGNKKEVNDKREQWHRNVTPSYTQEDVKRAVIKAGYLDASS